MAGILRSGRTFQRTLAEAIAKDSNLPTEVQNTIAGVLKKNPKTKEFTSDQFPGISFRESKSPSLPCSNMPGTPEDPPNNDTPPVNGDASSVTGGGPGSGTGAGGENGVDDRLSNSDPEVIFQRDNLPPPIVDQTRPPRMDPLAKYSIGHNIKELGNPDGSNRKKLLEWVRTLDGLGTEALRYALHTAKGRLRQFLASCCEPTWNLVKPKVIRKFLGPDFADDQLNKLLNASQGRDQSIPEYIQEVEYLVSEAFESIPSELEPPIVKALIKGLSNARLVQAIREKDPANLEEAIEYIDRYQHIVPAPKSSRVSTVDDLADLKREILKELKPLRSEAAPVAPSVPPKASVECYNCGKKGHLAKECRGKSKPKPSFQCFRCGESSHGIKDCPQPAPNPSSGKCDRCTQTGHLAKDCTTGPPKNPCKVCNECHWRYDCPNRDQTPSSSSKNS